MRRSLKAKLILSYLVVALVTVVVVSVLIRVTSGQSLANLIVDEQTAQLKDSLLSYYAANGTTDGFSNSLAIPTRSDPGRTDPGSAPNGGFNPSPHTRSNRGVQGVLDASYRALIPSLGYDVGLVVPTEKVRQSIPVEANGKTIAYILPDLSQQVQFSSEEQVFLQRTSLAIGLAAGAGVLVAVAMGYFLASRLIKPIRDLTQASQALAGGDLQQQVPVTSRDELGLLTATFNQMSADLAHADQQRKRLTADITHDLSTPLQVITGYMEMLEEGEVTLTPKRIEIIKTELGHLRRLVGDLGTLTQVENNTLGILLQPVQPQDLLQSVFHTYQPIAARQGVSLQLEVPSACPPIQVDEGRMLQVVKNLVENALRYTPPNGKIILRAVASERLELQVQDTGTGIDPEDLPYVFDRFYRADKARNANSGKMGLGLAICKALVTAQVGEISAASPGKDLGTTITISLPIQK